MTIYARIENGTVVEYPVLLEHIKTRRHRVDMYSVANIKEKPKIDENAQFLKQSLSVMDGVPIVNWIIKQRPCPLVLEMRQARIMMSRMGILSNVESAIAAMSGQTGEEAKIEWEYSTAFKRNDLLVNEIAKSMSISDEEMNTLFKEAYKL